LEAVSVDGRPHSASLDSLSLKNEAELLISCDEPIPEPTTTTPNPTANPTGNLSCGFENDNPCGWNVYGSEFWHLGQGMIGTKPYGLDGTPFGAGFVYVDSTSLPQTSQPAELESRFGPPMNSELTFNYRAYGFGVVSVILLAETEEGVRYILWSSHSVSQEWTSATARICIKDWHTVRSIIFPLHFTQPRKIQYMVLLYSSSLKLDF
jgi:MAM domain, meprin/A5/mu